MNWDEAGGRIVADAYHDEVFEKLLRIAGSPRDLRRGQTLRQQGSTAPQLFLLLSGWLACSVLIASGGRQIAKIHLPRTLVGATSIGSAVAHESVHALSSAEVAPIESQAVSRLFQDDPRLAAMMFLGAQEEQVVLMGRLASIGRTSALSRIAAVIVQLHEGVERGSGGREAIMRFAAPLTQEDIGDLTGLTSVHVNRTLKQLRLSKVVIWAHGTIHILDRLRLRQIAELQPNQPRDTNWIAPEDEA